MRKIASYVCVSFIGIGTIALTPPQANAMVMYSYAGGNFDTFLSDNSQVVGSYDATMSVTGEFTVAAPLISLPFGPIGTGTDIASQILGYSFSDGRQTLNDINSTIDVFRMATDSNGAPSAWQILLLNPFPSSTFVGAQQSIIFTQSGAFDKGSIEQCGGTIIGGPTCSPTFLDDARAPNGTWTSPPVPDQGIAVPEPSTLLLFGVGLAGLAGLGWRRRRA